MEANRIDPNLGYTNHDLLTAGFGISMGGIVFAGVAYAFYSFAVKQAVMNIQVMNIHAAWFFGITSFFIFSMGAGTFFWGLKKRGHGNSISSNPNPPESSNPSEPANTKA